MKIAKKKVKYETLTGGLIQRCQPHTLNVIVGSIEVRHVDT